jgi:hypothetical protein
MDAELFTGSVGHFPWSHSFPVRTSFAAIMPVLLRSGLALLTTYGELTCTGIPARREAGGKLSKIAFGRNQPASLMISINFEQAGENPKQPTSRQTVAVQNPRDPLGHQIIS